MLSGDDALSLDIIRNGGAGAISVIGNALVEETAAVIHDAMNGDYDKAAVEDGRLSDLYRLIFVDGNPAGIKVVLQEKGLLKNVLRLPLVKASIETSEAIVASLRNL